MSFEVFHPGRVIRPCDRAPAARAATMAERHVPSPHDLRLNLWTDGSPAKHTVGGVGICYGKWLPTQRDALTKSLSFVVPRVHDANECELVALADAMLVILDEIQENITTLRANNWATKVMIWSDSHTALKYLQNPQNLRRFGTSRRAEVRALILHLVSQTRSLPIKGPIEFYWVPGLCTTMHQTADFMTKNPLVKSGNAPISRAMKMLFPKPTAGVRPAVQPAPITASDSKSVKFNRGGAEKDDQFVGKTILKHTPENTELGSRNELKRRASVNADIDNDRPHKAIRQNEGVVHGNSGSSPSVLMSRSASQSTKPQPASVQSLNHYAYTTASTAPANNEEDVFFVAIDQIIQHSRERFSLDTICQQANGLQADQRDMIEKAMERQLLANEKPFDPALFFFRMRSCSEDGEMEACFPNTLSIVEDAVKKLPDPMRVNMQDAVKKQHEENRIWGAHLAIMQCMKPRDKAS